MAPAVPRSQRNLYSKSVVLITPGDETIRESGTGFVIATSPRATYIVTCAHVIQSWSQAVCVNGRTAHIEHDGAREGVDLAILRVDDLALDPLPTKAFIKQKQSVYCVSYTHLYGSDYYRTTMEAKAGRELTIQRRSFGRLVPGWEIVGANDSLVPGNSGSPVFDGATNAVVGVLSHAARDGGVGYAISSEAISLIWEPPHEASGPRSLKPSRLRSTDIPEVTAPVTDPDDLNRGRFGGSPEVNGRRLEAIITSKTADSFYMDLRVVSTDRSEVEPPAVFYLHDTYPRSKIIVHTLVDGAITLRDIYAYGTYVVGCQVRDREGNWVMLELDLQRVPAIPKRFHDR